MIEKMIENLGFGIFIFIGSFIEEIFPPLPSHLIVIITKISTSPNSYSLLYLFFIAIIAAIGKTFGALQIIPTTPVSLMCGVIKLNQRIFVVSTLIGLFVRFFALFYIGIFALSSPLFLTAFIMMSILVFIYYKKKRE